MGLLSREHPKAKPGGLFLLLFLEKPGIEPAKPRRWKSMLVYYAIYPTLTRFTKFRVFNLHITSTVYAANTLHQRILPREAIPSHYHLCVLERADFSVFFFFVCLFFFFFFFFFFCCCCCFFY